MAPPIDVVIGWLADPKLLAAFRGILRFVPAQDRDDVVSKIGVVLLENKSKRLPDEHGGFVAYAKATAYRQGKLHMRGLARDVHVAIDPKDLEAFKAFAIDPVEFIEREESEDRAVAAVAQLAEADPRVARDLEAMHALREGATHEDIAKARGDSPAALRKSVSRARPKLRAVWIAAAALMIALAWAAGSLQQKRSDEARLGPPLISPDVTLDQRLAAGSRSLAIEACQNKIWGKCLDLLDDANDFSGQGDDPEMRALRQQATVERQKLIDARAREAGAPDAAVTDKPRDKTPSDKPPAPGAPK
jgi:DNA-directed RNA polymerase specialized sigma24 family protein